MGINKLHPGDAGSGRGVTSFPEGEKCCRDLLIALEDRPITSGEWRNRYATIGELVEATFASQERYTAAYYVAHLRQASRRVRSPLAPGQLKDLDMIRIKRFADVQTISLSVIKKIRQPMRTGLRYYTCISAKIIFRKIVGADQPILSILRLGTSCKNAIKQKVRGGCSGWKYPASR
jgi:hypothetical protein